MTEPPFPLGPLPRRVNLSALDAAQRKAVWAWLQAHRPGIAAALEDPELQALRRTFAAQLTITVPAAEAGEKDTP